MRVLKVSIARDVFTGYLLVKALDGAPRLVLRGNRAVVRERREAFAAVVHAIVVLIGICPDANAVTAHPGYAFHDGVGVVVAHIGRRRYGQIADRVGVTCDRVPIDGDRWCARRRIGVKHEQDVMECRWFVCETVDDEVEVGTNKEVALIAID